jgi:hypothetical protein
MISCNGQAVLNELDRVFGHPHSAPYQNAKNNNTFGAIQNVQDNYKDLIIAYLVAGVDVGTAEWPAWCAYLKLLGTQGTQGPQNIYDIAQTRDNALSNNVGMLTSVHGGGGPVHTHRGSGSTQSTIDSPCPL